jgi:hypothetical protein
MRSQPIPGAENLPQHGVRALSRNGKYLFHAFVLEASTAKVSTAIIESLLLARLALCNNILQSAFDLIHAS